MSVIDASCHPACQGILKLVDICAAKQVELKELPPSKEEQEFMCMHGQEFVLPSNSLIPRLFPPPVFNCLQYANMEGEGLEIWSRVVTSGRQRVDTRGVVPFLVLSVLGLEARALARQSQYRLSFTMPGTL